MRSSTNFASIVANRSSSTAEFIQYYLWRERLSNAEEDSVDEKESPYFAYNESSSEFYPNLTIIDPPKLLWKAHDYIDIDEATKCLEEIENRNDPRNALHCWSGSIQTVRRITDQQIKEERELKQNSRYVNT
jgi:hypothetical protein